MLLPSLLFDCSLVACLCTIRLPRPPRRLRQHPTSSSSLLAAREGNQASHTTLRRRPGVALPCRRPRGVSPAKVPRTRTRNSFPTERRIASRYGAQRFTLLLGICPFRVLCTCDARFSSQRSLCSSLSALPAFVSVSMYQQAADAPRRPSICRRIAILP